MSTFQADTATPGAGQQVQQLFENRDYAAAIEQLQAMEPDPGGETDALLGLAHYLSQQYEAAVGDYERALQQQPDHPEWQHAHQLAIAHATAKLDMFVPPKTYFERDPLLGPSEIPPGTLPSPPRRMRMGLRRRVQRRVGNGLGIVASKSMSAITWAIGRTIGFQDEVWTNWYRRRAYLGVLTLAYMRDQLNRNNLKDVYPEGALTAYQAPGQQPPPGVTHFRTADGSWNNLENPKEGATGTRFPRNVANDVAHPETEETLMSPNPREVSRRLLERGDEMKEVPFLNMLAAAWIQFQNHDWISHGENLDRDFFEIPLAEDDPARIRYRQRGMLIGKTQQDPTRRAQGEPTPITFINEVTQWWDASQIYGSDQATVDHLRSHVDGKLRVNDDGTLPLDSHGIEESGMVRNWWVGLSLLHSLFVLEHNAICDHLKASYPDWDDNRLFNVARLINAAVTAKIHSVEWTPAILPNRALSDGLHANWYGQLTNMFRRREDRRTVADINVRNPELGGVVGNPIEKHGVPYGLTQEFVEVYRLHSLLPETLQIRTLDDPEAGVTEQVPFPMVRQAGSPQLIQRVGLSNLLYSFGKQHPGQLVLNNYPKFMMEFSLPGNPLFDLAAVDILRARERGVPRYNEFRRQLGLKPIRCMEDLTDDEDVVRRMKEVYGQQPEDVERIDLLAGTLAEGHRPTGFGFGETLFQIFILNASRRLQADRFYTDNYNEETYTKEGLDWIDHTDLKTVLLRHFPELAETGLANVTNAFEPWDTAPRLSPERHPLRAFDRDLEPDPWQGDAYR